MLEALDEVRIIWFILTRSCIIIIMNRSVSGISSKAEADLSMKFHNLWLIRARSRQTLIPSSIDGRAIVTVFFDEVTSLPCEPYIFELVRARFLPYMAPLKRFLE